MEGLAMVELKSLSFVFGCRLTVSSHDWVEPIVNNDFLNVCNNEIMQTNCLKFKLEMIS